MRILVLDDDEFRHQAFDRWYASDHQLSRALTASEAINLLQDEKRFDVAFLDHDLEPSHYQSYSSGESVGDRGTGMEVVNFIVKLENDRRPRAVVIHTWNRGRAHEMRRRLRDAGANALCWQFNPSGGCRIP